MKILATLATVALMTGPSFAAASCAWHDQTAQVSCADGQVYDSETRSCVPVSS